MLVKTAESPAARTITSAAVLFLLHPQHGPLSWCLILDARINAKITRQISINWGEFILNQNSPKATLSPRINFALNVRGEHSPSIVQKHWPWNQVTAASKENQSSYIRNVQVRKEFIDEELENTQTYQQSTVIGKPPHIRPIKVFPESDLIPHGHSFSEALRSDSLSDPHHNKQRFSVT